MGSPPCFLDLLAGLGWKRCVTWAAAYGEVGGAIAGLGSGAWVYRSLQVPE
jgi:hypothetical protein